MSPTELKLACEYEICQRITLTTALAGTSMSVFKYNTVWQCEPAGQMLDFSADMPNTFLYRSREDRDSLKRNLYLQSLVCPVSGVARAVP
jgi:hypothetical protein